MGHKTFMMLNFIVLCMMVKGCKCLMLDNRKNFGVEPQFDATFLCTRSILVINYDGLALLQKQISKSRDLIYMLIHG